jgi:Ca2+-binding EF-hand superfamily protein
MRLDTLSVNVDVQEMINEVDGDGDGKIDYNDFLILFREKTKTFFNV